MISFDDAIALNPDEISKIKNTAFLIEKEILTVEDVKKLTVEDCMKLRPYIESKFLIDLEDIEYILGRKISFDESKTPSI